MMGGWRSRSGILSKRRKKQKNDSGGHRFGIPDWRSRCGILYKRRNWKDELRGGVERLAFPLKDSQQKKQLLRAGFQANGFSAAGSKFIENYARHSRESHAGRLGGGNNNIY